MATRPAFSARGIAQQIRARWRGGCARVTGTCSSSDDVGLRADLHRRFLFLSAIRVWPPFDVKHILGVPPWSREAVVLFKKILIAIDNEPVAAHAADIGAELARLAGAEMAFIHVIDPEFVNAADTGIQPAVFAASPPRKRRES